MQKAIIAKENYPKALTNATSKHNLTPAQVEDLNFALKLCDLSPSRALVNLRYWSATIVAAAIILRRDCQDNGVDTTPSIPRLCRALVRTNYPEDGSASREDFEAAIHDIKPYSYRRRFSEVVDDFIDGPVLCDRYQETSGYDHDEWRPDPEAGYFADEFCDGVYSGA